MKLLLIFSIALICVGLSTQYPKFEDCTMAHPVFADKNVYFGLINQCVHVKCMDGEDYGMLACAEENCPPGKQVGRKDTSQIQHEEYPKCCGGPICAD